MAYFDLPLHELETYRPASTAQPDFEQFWLDTLAETAQRPVLVETTALDLPYCGVRFARVTYSGWADSPIVGTYACPEGSGPFPGLVLYHGYSSCRPDPFEMLSWTSQGYATLAIDVRGQSGESSDTVGYSGGHAPGYLTLGIGDPHHHYYRGVFVDGVRALACLAGQPEVDRSHMFVAGRSQGGGITLATAALWAMSTQHVPHSAWSGIRLRAAIAEIPFLCHFERAATIVDSDPYQEIGRYCRMSRVEPALVLRTLSYFDGMNFANYVITPTLVTAGLMDMVCPPSTIFAAYNAIPAGKRIIVDQFGQHDTFPGVPEARVRWFQQS